MTGGPTYDVFLCHNAEDKPVVKDIARKLKDKGHRPWLDEWELRPGLPWQPELEKKIKDIEAVAVFVGANGVGPWQQKEIDAYLRQFIKRGCPVIPVILPDCKVTPELPVFLEGNTWVDFRIGWDRALERLIWGSRGKSPRQWTCNGAVKYQRETRPTAQDQAASKLRKHRA